jgi:hypothetical protein
METFSTDTRKHAEKLLIFSHEILLKVALNTITSHTNLFLFFYIIVVDGQEFAIGT